MTLRLGVFFSGGASALRYLCEEDENFNKTYIVPVVFTDSKRASGISFAKKNLIPVEILDFKDFRRQNSSGNYFAKVLEKILDYQLDWILLSGFMRIVRDPLLKEFKDRILNVHPADLRILDVEGKRKYVGKDAVRDAIMSGEKEVRSTVHLVNEVVDGGKIITVSDPLPVYPGVSWKIHQEEMKWFCDGPACAKALATIIDKF